MITKIVSESLKGKSVLVTGGAGFIGSHIVEHLTALDLKLIRVIDNLSTGNINNIQPFIYNNTNIEFIYGDIYNLESCRKVVDGIDIICHQAALGSVPRSVDDPLTSHISNVDGFLNILLAAKERNIKRVVYASSSSVYGDHPVLPKKEENTGSVLSPYAATKAINELYAQIFTRCYDMQCIGLRYFNVFGPRQDPNGPYAAVIPKFIRAVIESKSPTINGDGDYSRDFTYVDNVVSANLLSLTTNNNKCYGDVFNIGAGGRITILEMFDDIKSALGSDIVPEFGPKRIGDIPHSNADISKAKDLLNYNPLIDFKHGIHETVKFYSQPS
jgi:UDP-N-acetylglucosamine 4-epimerase